MREIKFRAWAYARQKYFYPDDDGIIIQNGILEPIPNTDIEQFTGLCDKNGKDIYEGDILDIWYPDSCVENHHVEPVFYREDFACFDTHFVDDWSRVECEVIGNIHENPELIK